MQLNLIRRYLMKGINEDRAYFYKNRNLNIYQEYVETNQTMEQLADKYNITKQRIWQIIRRCTMGAGDYYRGFENYKDKEVSLKELGAISERRHQLLRRWMSEKYEIKVISLRDEGE